MKKIISHGKLEKYTRICTNCECVFEYDESDLEKRKGCDDYGEFEKEYVTCPECGDKSLVYLWTCTYDGEPLVNVW